MGLRIQFCLTHTNKAPRFSVGALLIVVWFSDAAPAAAQGLLQILVSTGQNSPDGNGTFADLGNPALNDQGDFVFSAALNNTLAGDNDNGGLFRWSDGPLGTIVRENESVPGGNGVFDALGAPSLNEAGEVAFRPTLRATAGGTTDNQAIYRSTPGALLVEIVRRADADPDPQRSGNFTALTNFTMSDAGQVSFYATLSGPSGGVGGKAGIFRGDGGPLATIVRSNQPCGIDQRLIYTMTQPLANAAGEVAFGGGLDLPGDMHIGDGFALYRGDGASLVPLVISGDPASNGIGTVEGYFAPVPINNAGMIAFRGIVEPVSGGSSISGWFRLRTTAWLQLCSPAKCCRPETAKSTFPFGRTIT